MRQIAKWTSLCIFCTVVGFGATYLVANSNRVVQTFAAMLPVQPAASVELLADSSADISPDSSAGLLVANAPAAVELAADGTTASTVGTLSAGGAPVAMVNAQSTPATQPDAPATSGLNADGELSAVGTINVVRPRQVVIGASGRVDEIAVEVGDTVAAGDLLVSLDTTYLDWDVEQAEIAFENARIEFEEAGELVDESDIAVAEAELLVAQENLADVEAGPSAEELAAAQSSVAAAQAAYAELQAQPTQAQINMALADLRRAEIAVQAAQTEYDRIAFLPEVAATSAAANLQSATIDLEEARAAFDEANQPAAESELQAANAEVQSALANLNELRLQPTAADLATANADVAAAQAALEDVMEGPQQGAVRQAELGVREAMIELEAVRLARENAEVVAPIDGTVLTVDVDLGEQVSAGDIVATLANIADIKLTVNVEQRDIARIEIGQPVEISIYALPAEVFLGVVDQIAPVADAGTGFVTFPVIIRLTDGPIDLILPGMTASATFIEADGEGDSATEDSDAAGSESAVPTVVVTPTAAATTAATTTPTAEATEEATAEPTVSATEEVTEEEAEELTEEATEDPTAEATVAATGTPEPEPTNASN